MVGAGHFDRQNLSSGPQLFANNRGPFVGKVALVDARTRLKLGCCRFYSRWLLPNSSKQSKGYMGWRLALPLGF